LRSKNGLEPRFVIAPGDFDVAAASRLARAAAKAYGRLSRGEGAVGRNASHALIPEQPAAVVDAIVAWIGTLPRQP
jgi:hypothetical protein